MQTLAGELIVSGLTYINDLSITLPTETVTLPKITSPFWKMLCIVVKFIICSLNIAYI